MQCGHCVAVCPVNAVEIPDYDMADVIGADIERPAADELVSLIKTRRSIRQYKDCPVARELIEHIIEAGRYTATARNRQALSFIIIEKEMQAFRALVIEELANKGREMLASDNTPQPMKGFARLWIAAGDAFRKNPDEKDPFFFGAPVVILIAGDNPIDAGLAASNMELVACAHNLGVLYSGFIVRGAGNEKTKTLAGVPAGKEVLAALVIGYPGVQYKRSAPRKKADIIWS